MNRRNFLASLIVVSFAPQLIERFSVKQSTKWSFYKNGTLISEFTLPNDGGVVVVAPRKLKADWTIETKPDLVSLNDTWVDLFEQDLWSHSFGPTL